MEIIKQKDVIEKIALLIKERNIIPVFGAEDFLRIAKQVKE